MVPIRLGRLLLVAATLASALLCQGCKEMPGARIGDRAPGISGNDIKGDYISLNNLKGKVVLVCFWTNSCCGTALKQLEPLYSRHKYDGLDLIAVNEIDSRQDVESYTRESGISFTMMTDERSMLFHAYHVMGFPTTFIIDRSGIIREKLIGEIDPRKLEQLLVPHLERKS
jgi:peroxiredoxin